MEIYETILLSVFDMIITLLLLHGIMKHFHTSIVDKIIYIILTSVIIAVSNIFIDSDGISHVLNTATAYAAFIIYLWKNKEREVSSNTIVFFIISLLVIVIQLSVIILLNGLIDEFKYSFFSGLTAQILGMMITLFISRVLPLPALYIFIEKKNIFFRVMITTVFVLYYSISVLWYMDSTHVLEGMIGMIITILLAIVVNTILLRDGLLSQAYEEKLQVYETYLPIIDDIVEEFRKKQHDYHNHLQTLAVMNERLNGDHSETLNEYIDGYNRDNIWRDLLKINNKILIALFYSKYVYANEQGVNLLFHISNFHYDSKYTNYELVEIYGILIDNAIEAAYNQETRKNIEITLEETGERNLFRIINPHEYISSKQINRFFEKGFSSKEGENRGIGLYKLKQLLEKKGDTIFFSYDTSLESVIVEIEHS